MIPRMKACEIESGNCNRSDAWDALIERRLLLENIKACKINPFVSTEHVC